MKNRFHSLFFFFSFSFVYALFPSLASADVLLDRVVAVVNDRVILKSELTERMFEKSQELAAKNIPVTDNKALQQQVLDSLILEDVQLDRAAALGLKAEDEEVNQQLEKIAQRNKMTIFQLRNRLNLEMENGFEKIRDKIRDQILIQKLREAEVISQVHVSESEIKHYLKRQKLSKRNTEVKLSHILIALPESATPMQRQQALEKIQKIRLMLLSGESFSKLAVRYSNGGHALEGGNLGWLKQDQVPTFFAEQVLKLEPGDISQIIESPSGFHLIKLDEEREAAGGEVTEYHLHRFMVLSDNAQNQEVPQNIADIAANMKSLEDFNALSTEFNDLPSDLNANSDLGWRTLDAIPDALREHVKTLAPNHALTPIATPQGWLIIFLEDKRKVFATENETQEAVQAIRMRKANEMFDLWLRRLKDEAFIQIKLDDDKGA
ncbi:peptidylprolyl isomerase [Thiomicrorhabdus heinhorstiae]|uniref:Chaperone SurA n=1 Tax=Thiomicrorhabdus heinhorstiae TaxID=2748010 RepID=A0ABS0BV13_9GAMM|nr:peptidylprolyl isomerase [Thiomicrorhabdus heinhorstiae]MBF6057174.1 peptidylprolyl isomerase [Thiomicrorhabdus heinhorstiae]